MGIKFTEGRTSSKTVLMDYFPLYVLFADEEPDLMRHFDIAKSPTDCIEFACDYATGRLLRMNLVLANSYTVVHSSIASPEYAEGSFEFDLPAMSRTDVFETMVYDDGIEILLSDGQPVSYCGSGDMCIAFDARGELARINVLHMTPEAISHAIEEIESDNVD